MEIPEIKDKELHRIVTATLIYKANKDKQFTYLLIKRALHKKVQPGKWAYPGGGLNVDDYIHIQSYSETILRWPRSLEISLRREVSEEVGLEVEKPEFFMDVTFINPDGTPVICFCYFAPYVSGEVILDEDSTDFAWVNLEEAKKYDLVEGIWDEIRQVDEILKSRK